MTVQQLPNPPEQGIGLTEALASQAASLTARDIPAHVRRIAEFALLDWYAVTWAGAGEEACRLLRQTLPAAAEGEARVIGTAGYARALDAAFLNGAAGHALDYDDVHNALPGHVTAPVAPAVLALAEKTGAGGEALTTAFVAGFEFTCRIGCFTSPNLFQRGYQGSSTAGCLGAAVACGHLLGLDAERMRVAIGLAATQAGGIHATFGSMAKCMNVGKASQSGLLAALLAADGFDCSATVLEAPRGYGAVFADGGNDTAALGVPPGGWHLCRNLFKLHAACFMNHAPLEALRKLREGLPFGAAELERMTVRVEPHYHRVVLTPPPSTGLEVKFNLPFCLAMAVAGLDTGAPETFSDVTACRADLHAIASRIEVRTDPGLHFESAEIAVELADGRSARMLENSGEPETDLDLLARRLDRKARTLLSADAAATVLPAFLDLGGLARAADLHPRH